MNRNNNQKLNKLWQGVSINALFVVATYRYAMLLFGRGYCMRD